MIAQKYMVTAKLNTAMDYEVFVWATGPEDAVENVQLMIQSFGGNTDGPGMKFTAELDD